MRIWWLAVVLGLVVSCVNSKPPAALAEGCLINTDCASPLVCAFRRCHVECTTTRDCPAGTFCRPADRPFNVCLIVDPAPNELLCARNSDCSGELVCGSDGKCRSQCAADKDCLDQQVCSNGQCAEPAELVSGTLPVTDPQRLACYFNSECPLGQVCTSGRCTTQCITDRDCAAGSTCTAGACVVPGTMSTTDGGSVPRCSVNSDCGENLHCNAQGYCGPECYFDRDCGSGVRCEPNDPNAVSDGGRNAGHCLNPVAGETGSPCSLNSECHGNLRCTSGRCAAECLADPDCPGTGSCCVNALCYPYGQCLMRTPDGGFDAGTLPGFDAGACSKDLDCQNGVFCDGYETCVAGVCHLAARLACDDNNPCSSDTCTEAQQSCSYASVLTDADHDGHFPIACGGSNSDDCDDTDPNTWGGVLPAPERCDFKDNNCNGLVDENLWAEQPGSRIALSTGGLYPPGVGAPAVRRANGSLYIAAASDSTARGTVDLFRLDQATLGITTGPVGTVGSQTAWTSVVTGSDTYYGKRVAKPALAVSDAGELMVTAMTHTFPNNYCNTGPMRLDSAYARVSPDLLHIDGGVTASNSQGSGCVVLNSTTGSVSTSVWVPQTGKWAIVTPTWESNSAIALYVTTLDSAGVLSTPHHLLEGTMSYPTAAVQYQGDAITALPSMAVGPTGVFVGWLQYASAPRYVILSYDMTNIVAGPFTLAASGPTEIKSAVFDGTNFLINTGLASVSSVNTVVRISPAGVQLPGSQQLPPSSPSGFSQTLRDSDTSAMVMSPSQVGLFAVTSRSTGMTFSWGLNRPAAGLLNLDVALSTATPHSDFGIAPIDDKHVVVFWADGDLQRLTMQCGP